MKQAIAAGVLLGLLNIGLAESAAAGVWRWGCRGPLGDKEIIFTRYSLIIVPPQPSRGTLRDLVFSDDLAKEASVVEQYLAADANSGFTPTLEFMLGDDVATKITLSEKSSKTIFHHSTMVCGRDEMTDRFRKVYSYQRGAEPARDVTLQCMEYMLTSRGGRPCIDRKQKGRP